MAYLLLSTHCQQGIRDHSENITRGSGRRLLRGEQLYSPFISEGQPDFDNSSKGVWGTQILQKSNYKKKKLK